MNRKFVQETLELIYFRNGAHCFSCYWHPGGIAATIVSMKTARTAQQFFAIVRFAGCI